MKVAGVVAEYNPFHKGHEYQLAQTRSKLSATHIAVCMSGSFTQRGDCARISKFARAETAIQCGADLVLELPVPWAVAPAGKFAFGAVSVLSSLGCLDALSFGSECGDIEILKTAAEAVKASDSELFSSVKGGGSLAASRYELIAAKYGETAAAPLKSPNDTLAVEYILSADKLCKGIELCAIPRIGADHDGTDINGGFASASLIRSMIDNDGWQDFVPDTSKKIIERELSAGSSADIKRLSIAVLSKLRTMKAEDYLSLFEVSEGLENRIYNEVRTASSLIQLYDSIKTKRYSHSRIRRIVLSAFLGIRKELTVSSPPYIRILAMNRRGREILASAKPTLPIIARYADVKNLDAAGKEIFELECKATDQWALSLLPPAPCGLDITNKLIVM